MCRRLVLLAFLAATSANACVVKLSSSLSGELVRVDSGQSYAIIEANKEGSWDGAIFNEGKLIMINQGGKSSSDPIKVEDLQSNAKTQLNELLANSLDGISITWDNGLNIDGQGLQSIQNDNEGQFAVTKNDIIFGRLKPNNPNFDYGRLMSFKKSAVVLVDDKCRLEAKLFSQLPTNLQQHLSSFTTGNGQPSSDMLHDLPQPGTFEQHDDHRQGQDATTEAPASSSPFPSQRDSSDEKSSDEQSEQEMGFSCQPMWNTGRSIVKCAGKDVVLDNFGSNVQLCCNNRQSKKSYSISDQPQGQPIDARVSNNDMNVQYECRPEFGGCQRVGGINYNNRGVSARDNKMQVGYDDVRLSVCNNGINMHLLSTYPQAHLAVSNSGCNMRVDSMQTMGSINVHNSGIGAEIRAVHMRPGSAVYLRNTGTGLTIYL